MRPPERRRLSSVRGFEFDKERSISLSGTRTLIRLAAAMVLLGTAAGAQTNRSGFVWSSAAGGTTVAMSNTVRQDARPWNFGGLMQSGFGVTEDRGGLQVFDGGGACGQGAVGDAWARDDAREL